MRRRRTNHHEFLAAVAGDQVGGRQGAAQHLCQGPQHGVTDLVTVTVVDAFEQVHVQQRHLGGPVGCGAPQGQLARLHQVLAVVQAGQAVADADLADAFVGLTKRPQVLVEFLGAATGVLGRLTELGRAVRDFHGSQQAVVAGRHLLPVLFRFPAGGVQGLRQPPGVLVKPGKQVQEQGPVRVPRTVQTDLQHVHGRVRLPGGLQEAGAQQRDLPPDLGVGEGFWGGHLLQQGLGFSLLRSPTPHLVEAVRDQFHAGVLRDIRPVGPRQTPGCFQVRPARGPVLPEQHPDLREIEVADRLQFRLVVLPGQRQALLVAFGRQRQVGGPDRLSQVIDRRDHAEVIPDLVGNGQTFLLKGDGLLGPQKGLVHRALGGKQAGEPDIRSGQPFPGRLAQPERFREVPTALQDTRRQGLGARVVLAAQGCQYPVRVDVPRLPQGLEIDGGRQTHAHP